MVESGHSVFTSNTLKDEKELLDMVPTILEASTQAIVSIDKSGTIQGFNSQFLNTLSVTARVCNSIVSGSIS